MFSGYWVEDCLQGWIEVGFVESTGSVVGSDRMVGMVGGDAFLDIGNWHERGNVAVGSMDGSVHDWIVRDCFGGESFP